jgi:hypothetical protein
MHLQYSASVSEAHVYFFTLRAFRSSYQADLNVIFDYSLNFWSTGSFTYADVRTAKFASYFYRIRYSNF